MRLEGRGSDGVKYLVGSRVSVLLRLQGLVHSWTLMKWGSLLRGARWARDAAVLAALAAPGGAEVHAAHVPSTGATVFRSDPGGMSVAVLLSRGVRQHDLTSSWVIVREPHGGLGCAVSSNMWLLWISEVVLSCHPVSTGFSVCPDPSQLCLLLGLRVKCRSLLI